MKHFNVVLEGERMTLAAFAAREPSWVRDAAALRGLVREPSGVVAPPRPGDVRDSWADVSAAREALGFEPRVGLEEGLRRTAEVLLG